MKAVDSELMAIYSLMDDPQPAVQRAVRDRIFELGEDVVGPLRLLCEQDEGHLKTRIEDLISELRMTRVLERLGGVYQDTASDVDLEEGVFIIAKYGHPGIDVEEYRRRLDDMVLDIRIHAGVRAVPIDHFMRMKSYLFGDLGFVGNRQDYYNADNSFMNEVLETRKGIPITLSVLMLLLGKRLGLPLHGIGMPMHFLVQYDDGTRMFFVDAFNGGMVITQDQCRSMLASTGIQFNPSMLVPVSNREIVERMWRNLFLAYQQSDRKDEAAQVGRILSFINPDFKVNTTSAEEDDDEEDDVDDEQ